MAVLTTFQGMTLHEIDFEINRGDKFVVFQYCVSIVVITFRRSTPVKFIRAGESAATRSMPWTILSLLLGCWGIPWGFIYTPQVLYKNLKGGTDVTASVRANLAAAATETLRATG